MERFLSYPCPVCDHRYPPWRDMTPSDRSCNYDSSSSRSAPRSATMLSFSFLPIIIFLFAAFAADAADTVERVSLGISNKVHDHILLVEILIRGAPSKELEEEMTSFFGHDSTLSLATIDDIKEDTDPTGLQAKFRFSAYRIEESHLPERHVKAQFVAYQVQEYFFSPQLRNYIFHSLAQATNWPEKVVTWVLRRKNEKKSRKKTKSKPKKQKDNPQVQTGDLNVNADCLELEFTVDEMIVSGNLLHILKLDANVLDKWIYTLPEGVQDRTKIFKRPPS